METPVKFKTSSPWNNDVMKAISITEKLNQARENFERKDWKKRSLYRVPWCLRSGQSTDHGFRPRFVSIGPYHHGEPQVQPMEFHKYRVLHSILKHTAKDINEFILVLNVLEHEARACYEDLPETSFPSENFVEMLLLDGCFVLYFLNRYCCSPEHNQYLGYEDEDPVFSKFYMASGIVMDMMLLENQLPLFILNELYEVLFNGPGRNNIVDQMVELFDCAWVIGRDLTSSEGAMSSSELRNNDGNINMFSCLEVFWHNLMYDNTTKKYTEKRTQERRLHPEDGPAIDLKQFVIPSVTLLKEAGVKLMHKNTTPFWDVEFKEGILKLPQIMICAFSESIFLNLMAFELSHLRERDYKIIPYVLFMDSLVNSASDVAEFRRHGIIVCAGPTDEEVAQLFNRIGRRVFIPFDQFIPSDQFDELSRKINMYCNRRRNRWRANLMHSYFNTPWAIISVIAAAVLMLLTIVQTWYTIGQYYQKNMIHT